MIFFLFFFFLHQKYSKIQLLTSLKSALSIAVLFVNLLFNDYSLEMPQITSRCRFVVFSELDSFKV